MGKRSEEASKNAAKKHVEENVGDPIRYQTDKVYRETYDYLEGRKLGSRARKRLGTFGNALAGDFFEFVDTTGKSDDFKRGYKRGRTTYGERPPYRSARRSGGGGGGGGAGSGSCLSALLKILIGNILLCVALGIVYDLFLAAGAGLLERTAQILPATGEKTVYVVEVASGETERLARGYDPVWSPDGTKIAFDQESILADRIVLMGVDGSGFQKTLPHLIGPVSWSPNGKKFVALKGADTLVIVSAEGEILQEIRPPGVEGSANPAYAQWSPSGGKIAFAVGGGRTSWSIYTVNDDGSKVHKIAKGAWFGWSPNGRYIAVSNGGLTIMNRYGGDKWEATAPGEGGWDFGWSPRGGGLIFSSDGWVQTYTPRWGEPGEGWRHKIVQGEYPRYSPDELWFAYQKGGSLYVRDIWSEEDIKIPHSGGCQRSFVWSPDGKSLAFSTRRWVYVVQPNEGEPTKLGEGE
jgi:hypothetical protein